MKIELSPLEGEYAKQMAKRYKKKTGDSYSMKFIVTMLAQKYEQTLKEDLEEILSEKIRLFEEEQVIKEKQ